MLGEEGNKESLPDQLLDECEEEVEFESIIPIPSSTFSNRYVSQNAASFDCTIANEQPKGSQVVDALLGPVHPISSKAFIYKFANSPLHESSHLLETTALEFRIGSKSGDESSESDDDSVSEYFSASEGDIDISRELASESDSIPNASTSSDQVQSLRSAFAELSTNTTLGPEINSLSGMAHSPSIFASQDETELGLMQAKQYHSDNTFVSHERLSRKDERQDTTSTREEDVQVVAEEKSDSEAEDKDTVTDLDSECDKQLPESFSHPEDAEPDGSYLDTSIDEPKDTDEENDSHNPDDTCAEHSSTSSDEDDIIPPKTTWQTPRKILVIDSESEDDDVERDLPKAESSPIPSQDSPEPITPARFKAKTNIRMILSDDEDDFPSLQEVISGVSKVYIKSENAISPLGDKEKSTEDVKVKKEPTSVKKLNEVWEISPIARTPFKEVSNLVPVSSPATPLVKKSRKSVVPLPDREQLTRNFYAEFNKTIFDGKLPHDLEITWSIRLNKTAGRTHTRLDRVETPEGVEQDAYVAQIELATKVVDTIEKLRNTLVHEMIHAAVWILDHDNKNPHGKLFKAWGAKAMARYDDIKVTTSHSYDIVYSYQYECTNPNCKKVYGRHSKSINVDTHGCGHCKSKLVLIVN